MNEVFDKEFTHLKIHTQYSICEGALKTADLAKYCKDNKIKAITEKREQDRLNITSEIENKVKAVEDKLNLKITKQKQEIDLKFTKINKITGKNAELRFINYL